MMHIQDTTLPKKRGSSILKRILWTFLLFIFLIIAGFFLWKYAFTYSSGIRYGLLQKFSHKGNIFKTYEGELLLSGIRSNVNTPIATEKFFFSVSDESVANKLMNSQGMYITVHYKEKNGALPWRGDSRYIVDSVRVDPNNQRPF